MSPSIDSDGILLSPSLAPTMSPVSTPPTPSPDLELLPKPAKDEKLPTNSSNKESPIIKPLRLPLPQPPIIVRQPTEQRGRTLTRTPSPNNYPIYSRSPSPVIQQFPVPPVIMGHRKSTRRRVDPISPIIIPAAVPTSIPNDAFRVTVNQPATSPPPFRVVSSSSSRSRSSRSRRSPTPPSVLSRKSRDRSPNVRNRIPRSPSRSRSRSRSNSRPPTLRRYRQPRSPRKPSVGVWPTVQPWRSPVSSVVENSWRPAPVPAPYTQPIPTSPYIPMPPMPPMPSMLPPQVAPAYPTYSPWATTPTKHHHRFFFSDGNVAFQLKDGTIYKVHRIFFTQNSDMLSAMISPFTVSNPEWSPVHLWDVEPKAFESLLSIFYPKDYLNSEIETVEDWTALLSLASKYGMKKIRDLAINRLGSMASPVDKIALANEYKIKEWLIPAYTELCTRFEPLTLEEGKKLGVDAMIKLGGLKHEIKENLATFLDAQKVSKAVEATLDKGKSKQD